MVKQRKKNNRKNRTSKGSCENRAKGQKNQRFDRI